jgi:hypothetical protein
VNRSAYDRSKRASRKPDGKTWPDITPSLVLLHWAAFGQARSQGH